MVENVARLAGHATRATLCSLKEKNVASGCEARTNATFSARFSGARSAMIAAAPATNLEPLLARLPRSGRVLIVHPVTTDANDWDAPWTQLVRRRSAQWGRAVAEDSQFKRIGAVPSFYRKATRIGIRGVLYEKTGT